MKKVSIDQNNHNLKWKNLFFPPSNLKVESSPSFSLSRAQK